MTARSPQRDGAGCFTAPAQVNHRRYEALRAFFVDGLTYQQAADRFGYTRWVAAGDPRPGRHGPARPGPHGRLPGTRVIPAPSWLLSLLALKLTRTRRVSHVDDLLADPAAGLLAGLGTLPKKSALTSYSYGTSHDHQRNFLAALDQKMISARLATGEQAIFDLDFHAVVMSQEVGRV